MRMRRADVCISFSFVRAGVYHTVSGKRHGAYRRFEKDVFARGHFPLHRDSIVIIPFIIVIIIIIYFFVRDIYRLRRHETNVEQRDFH